MRPFAIILSVLIGLQGIGLSARAENIESPVSKMAHRYGALANRYASNLELRNRIRQKAMATADKSLAKTGHVGQVLVLMWILGAVEIVKKEVQFSKAQGRPMSELEILKKSGEAAEVILNSGSIWSGFLGAGIASKVIKGPLLILQQLGEQTETRRALKVLIQSGAATLGTFLGWEMASELFTEASEMMESADDRARAEHLLPLFANTLVSGISGSALGDSNDSRILRKIVSNMFTIVLFDSDLRSTWLNNAWRNRIATGQFATLVTGMASSTAVGTLVFPGAGTAVGFMFGVAGGLLSLAVPENQQDRLTDWIQDGRSAFWNLGNGKSLFRHHVATVTDLLLQCIPQQIACPPLLQYDFKPFAQEQALTIASDRIRRYDLRLQELIGLRAASLNSGNTELANRYGQEIQTIAGRYRESLNEFKQVYAIELRHLQSALNTFNSAGALTSAHFQEYPQLQFLYRRKVEVQKISSLLNELTDIGASSLERPSEDYLRVVLRFSVYGFQEAELLKAIAD